MPPDSVAKRKLQGDEFFAKITEQESIAILYLGSIALPKSPVSLARGDEVPHIFTTESHAHGPQNFWSPVQNDFCNTIHPPIAAKPFVH